jgi:hypothetical protein
MVKSTTLVDDDLWKFTDGKDDAMTWYAMSHDDFYKQIYHRDDGPAYVSTNGTKKWYCRGKLHRVDGPAIMWGSGDIMWFIHGLQYSFREYLTLPHITPEMKTILILTYSHRKSIIS